MKYYFQIEEPEIKTDAVINSKQFELKNFEDLIKEKAMYFFLALLEGK